MIFTFRPAIFLLLVICLNSCGSGGSPAVEKTSEISFRSDVIVDAGEDLTRIDIRLVHYDSGIGFGSGSTGASLDPEDKVVAISDGVEYPLQRQSSFRFSSDLPLQAVRDTRIEFRRAAEADALNTTLSVPGHYRLDAPQDGDNFMYGENIIVSWSTVSDTPVAAVPGESDSSPTTRLEYKDFYCYAENGQLVRQSREPSALGVSRSVGSIENPIDMSGVIEKRHLDSLFFSGSDPIDTSIYSYCEISVGIFALGQGQLAGIGEAVYSVDPLFGTGEFQRNFVNIILYSNFETIRIDF